MEQAWRHKDTNYRQSTLAQNKYTNDAAEQIDSLKRLLVKIEKDSIYTKYFYQAKKADKKRNEIFTCMLQLKPELTLAIKTKNRKFFFFNNR